MCRESSTRRCFEQLLILTDGRNRALSWASKLLSVDRGGGYVPSNCTQKVRPILHTGVHSLFRADSLFVQVLSFSDLAGEASYRPLTGIPNPLPLAVHAWRHAFDTAFLRQEVAWQYSNDADITRISSQSASRWQGVRERRLAGWGQYVCRWVFGNSPQARNLLTR